MPEANKIILNGQTLIDLTQDTATAADVAQGKTFHNAAGVSTTGSYVNPLVGVLDGSATSITVSDYGVTSLAPYRFYNFTNLQNLDLTGVTDIPVSVAESCSNLTNVTLGLNITNIGQRAFYGSPATINELNGNNCSISDYAFRNGPKITKLSGSYSGIFDGFSGMSSLTTVDIKINGSLGSGETFNGCSNVSSFRIDPASNITDMGISSGKSFRQLGYNRADPSSNVFVLDFRNSTFRYGGGYSGFEYTTYMDIYFPSTMTTLSNNNDMFYGSNHLNIFYKSIPAVRTDAFGYTNNCATIKNFFPYNLAQTAKTSTNWSSSTNGIVNSIYGYAEENTFSQGATLPATDADGYELTWYSDTALTNQVTTVTDPTQIYYCAVGAKVAVPLTITTLNCSITISDGTHTYTNGQCIPYNTTVTITGNGDSGYNTLYALLLNGNTITNGSSYTVLSTDAKIAVKCAFDDGSLPVVDTIFGNNSASQIKAAVDSGLHRILWSIGDTKTITLTDNTQVDIRYVDQQANRYQKSDLTGYSNAVFGFVTLPLYTYMDQSGIRNGWPATYMYSTIMPQIYSLLPSDWQSVLVQGRIPSATGGSTHTIVYADTKIFIPSGQEMFGDAYLLTYYPNENCFQFDYYTADSYRIKQYNGTNSIYWTRSPYASTTNQATLVGATGSISSWGCYNSVGVPAYFIM